MTILPNPIYTGAGPFERNVSSSDEDEYSGGSRKKKPHTSGIVSEFNSQVT
jgi:hypothetical protein